MKTTFIYALCEPGTRTVRYIGMTGNPKRRLREHLNSSIKFNSHLGHWLKYVLTSGKRPNLVVLREVLAENWELAEERYIRLARGLGMKLVNATDGGEGNQNPSPETRAKTSASMRGKHAGENNPMFGRTGDKCPSFGAPMSEAQKKLISETRKLSGLSKGENNPMFGLFGEKHPKFGKKLTLEACAEISARTQGEKNPRFGKVGTFKGRRHSDITRARMRLAWAARKQRSLNV